MTLSAFLKKIFASQKSSVSQAGQAVVEYLLVLVVTVSVIMGILYQFNDAFKNFLDNYFGDYIACLLETGELPSLGGEGPTQGECNAGFAQFNISSGRPSKGNQSGGGNSEGDSSDGSSSSEGSGSSGRSRSGRPSQFNTSGATGNGESRGGLGSKSRPGRQSLGNNQQTGNPSGLDSDSTEGDSIGGRRGRRRKKVIIIQDTYVKDPDKLKPKKNVSVGKRPKSARERDELSPPIFDLEVPEAKRTLAEEEDVGFSFGFLLKLMMIAGILIALIVFLGGQAVSIKKSWQKSE